jgi:hypothetical protein
MEQMIATTYWASKDKANFKISYVTEQANFLSLVSQLYDMRRGYDVDRGTDKPDILEFPENKVEDQSRCVGGGVNSLSWTLASSHIAYNPKKIELCDIERELFLIYEKVVKDHVEEINNIINVYGEILWASNNKVTGNVRAYLNNIFRTEYLKDFENSFKGYISDGNFYALIEQGLDNIKMPNEIGFRIEKVGFNDIKYAISQGLISLLNLDQYHGYESTLNYLSRLNPQEKLTEKLCDLAIGNSAPSAIATLSFLSRSNLAEEYKNLEVFMVKGASIKLNEIASLTTEELEIIYKTDADNLIEICINNSCHNLFSLYYKKVGLSEQELTKKCANSQLTPLHYAVQHGYTEIISTIVETPGIDQQKLLEIKDKYDHTSLHLAVGSNQIDAVRVILEIPGIDKQKLLEIQDENGYTALHGASIVSQVNAIKVMLNTPKINKQKLLEIQDGNGNTILHLATGRNQVDTIKVIVETPEINTQSLLKIQDKNGYTALHMATGIGLVDAIKAILEAPGVDIQVLLENTV